MKIYHLTLLLSKALEIDTFLAELEKAVFVSQDFSGIERDYYIGIFAGSKQANFMNSEHTTVRGASQS